MMMMLLMFLVVWLVCLKVPVVYAHFLPFCLAHKIATWKHFFRMQIATPRILQLGDRKMRGLPNSGPAMFFCCCCSCFILFFAALAIWTAGSIVVKYMATVNYAKVGKYFTKGNLFGNESRHSQWMVCCLHQSIINWNVWMVRECDGPGLICLLNLRIFRVWAVDKHSKVSLSSRI